MESPTRLSTVYNVANSVARMNQILSGADTSYEEVDSIPERSKLTFTNGFYVNCSSVWVDLRESSKLTEKYRRPSLAKLYRAYISELVAVMHLSPRCVEVNIQGDAVWGVFDTKTKSQINDTFETALQCRSLIDVLNCRLKKYGFDALRAGIGVDYGRALMIKAGYSGSGINDVVYMGDVVNRAAHLSGHGSVSPWDPPVVLSEVFHQNLKDDYQALCKHSTINLFQSVYLSSAVNVAMQDWIDDNCA